MWIEQTHNPEMIKSVYDQIKATDESPKELTQDERSKLISSYENECKDIQDETCSSLQELEKVMHIFEEVSSLDPEVIKKVQMIIGVKRWSGRDGIFGPASFELFDDYKNETNFSWGVEELLQKYKDFGEIFLLSDDKHLLQPIGGKDGQYGQGTFKHMLMQGSHDIAEEEVLIVNAELTVDETSSDEQIGTWSHHSEIFIPEENKNNPEEELSQYPQEKIEEAMSWIEEKVSNYNMKRLHLYFEIEEGNIEWLAVAVMDFQSKYSLDNSDELDVDWKPWSGTLWKIDFTEIDRELLPETNREFIDSFVPDHWKEAVTKFVVSLEPNEILSPSDPITVCDSSNNSAIYLIDGEYKTFPVIYGSWGFSNGYVASGDQKTPRWVPMRFGSVRIPSSPYWDASNGQESSTVMWASLQSTETQTTQDWIQTWKWFHWVADHRMEKMEDTTIWCVGMWVWIVREIARDIQSNWNKWYWFIA